MRHGISFSDKLADGSQGLNMVAEDFECDQERHGQQCPAYAPYPSPQHETDEEHHRIDLKPLAENRGSDKPPFRKCQPPVDSAHEKHLLHLVEADGGDQHDHDNCRTHGLSRG